MKKIVLSLLLVGLFSFAHAQLMVAKMVGKDADKYGLGYGLFTYLDYPLPSGNQSLRLELMDLVMFPMKNENFFTTKAGMKANLSIKLGYKYVFSESQTGFYVIPSVGYCRVVFTQKGSGSTYGDGIAGALEGGYALGVGQKGHTINFGIKYEYDRGNATHTLQTVGFRVSYAFNMFGRMLNGE